MHLVFVVLQNRQGTGPAISKRLVSRLEVKKFTLQRSEQDNRGGERNWEFNLSTLMTEKGHLQLTINGVPP